MHISEFASKLRCQHCGMEHGTNQWPTDGDRVPFYFQDSPGRYTLSVTCPKCKKEWYVVWDQNPGPITPLLF